MANLYIRLDEKALGEYERQLETLAERALDASPGLRAIADDVHATEARMFTSGGASVGGWDKDTDDWIARKTAQNRSPRTLVYTGTLERSLISKDAKYSLDIVGSDQLTVGTIDPVAHLIAAGTGDRHVKTWRGEPLKRPRFAGRVKPHKLLPWTAVDETRWSRILEEYLVEGL